MTPSTILMPLQAAAPAAQQPAQPATPATQAAPAPAAATEAPQIVAADAAAPAAQQNTTTTTQQPADPAQDGKKQEGMDWTFIGMMVLIFVAMYFFFIRPQKKQQKELNNFRNAIEKGSKVRTAGGIYGTVKEVKENSILIEVDSDVTLRVDKSMIMPAPAENK